MLVNENDNANADSNNINFTIKQTKKKYVLYQHKTLKYYQNLSGRKLKGQYFGMNINQNVKIKIAHINMHNSLNENLK